MSVRAALLASSTSLIVLAGAGTAQAVVTVQVANDPDDSTLQEMTIADSTTAPISNSVTVTCESIGPGLPRIARVRVNGGLVGGFTPPTCNKLVRIEGFLNDGNDTVDLSTLTRTQLHPSMADPERVAGGISMDLGVLESSADGNTFKGSEFGEVVTGGATDDDIVLGPGDDRYIATRGGGNDTVDAGLDNDSLRALSVSSVILTDSAFTTPNGTSVITSFESAALFGGTGNDLLDARGFRGSAGIVGNSGDDTIYAAADGDIFAGNGNDLVVFGGSDVTVDNFKVAGDHPRNISEVDRVGFVGTTGADKFDSSAFPGPATAEGGGGDDVFVGGPGVTTFTGGDGRDTLTAGGGASTIDGGTDDDKLFGGGAASTLKGGTGNDQLTSGSGGGTLQGEAGDDLVKLGPGADTAAGGDGSDVVEGDFSGDTTLDGANFGAEPAEGFERARATGSESSDRLDGTRFPGPVSVKALGGDDTLLGGGAADEFDGGAGNDTFDGGDGADLLSGADGTDTFAGGPGNDAIDGGGDADKLDGGEGNDTVNAGAGDDQFTISPGNDAFEGGEGTDTIDYAGMQAITIDLGGGASGVAGQVAVYTGIERAFGGPGNDTLLGSPGNDELHGRAGWDVLDGRAGSDQQFGEAGADFLKPGAGGAGDADVLIGGDGVDLVSYVGRNEPLTLDLNGAADDGGPGEGDQVDPSIEILVGGNAADKVTLPQGTPTQLRAAGKANTRIVQAGGGNDTVVGTALNDILGGGSGNDSIRAGAGNDVVNGSTGDDTTDSGAGNDRIRPGAGVDRVEAGAGSDIVFSLDAARDRVACGSGRDAVYTGLRDVLGRTCETGSGRGETEKPSAPGGNEDGTNQTIGDGDGVLGGDGTGTADPNKNGVELGAGDLEDAGLTDDGEESGSAAQAGGFDFVNEGFGDEFGADEYGMEGFDEFSGFDDFEDGDDAFGDDQGLDGDLAPAPKVTTKLLKASRGRYAVKISCPKKVDQRCISELSMSESGFEKVLASKTFAVKKGKSITVRLKPTKAGAKALKKLKNNARLDLLVEGRDRGIGLWHVVKTTKLSKPKASGKTPSKKKR